MTVRVDGAWAQGRSIGQTWSCGRGYFSLRFVPVFLPTRVSRRTRQPCAHLLRDDVVEEFGLLDRFFLKEPQDAYFIGLLNSWHRSCSLSLLAFMGRPIQ